MGKKASVSRYSVGQRGSDLASKGIKEGFSEEVVIGASLIGPVGAYRKNAGGEGRWVNRGN